MTVSSDHFAVVVEDGFAVVTFDRPPVNAVSLDVYRALGALSRALSTDEAVRCVVLTAPAGARAWCGGADVGEFRDLDEEGRIARYEVIHAELPEFERLAKPVIAAINRPAVGVGILLASLCDIRIAADTAFFSAPEIDMGVLAAFSPLVRAGVPSGLIAEMTYTGRRVAAGELLGFLNRVVPEADVLPVALELARTIASKSLRALVANKRWFLPTRDMTWIEAQRATAEASAELTAAGDGREGIDRLTRPRTP